VRKVHNIARHTWSKCTRTCEFVVRNSEKFHHLVICVATILAGLWTYRIFVVERQSQAHLGLEVKTTQVMMPASTDHRLVFMDVILKNEGKRKLEAEVVPTTKTAYADAGEILKYPCGIQIRQILTSQIQTNKSLDFFNDTNILQCPIGIPGEIDLLSEYELVDNLKSSSDSATPQFWIEPGEEYHLGTSAVLQKGSYLIRFHFVGSKSSDEEFWSRIIFMQID
jgi:hypothetical protein